MAAQLWVTLTAIKSRYFWDHGFRYSAAHSHLTLLLINMFHRRLQILVRQESVSF